jgi:hypothetical protein
VLRQKDEAKNKNEKKIAETEIETKTSELISNFQTVLLANKRMLLLYHPRILIKNKKSVNKTMRFLKPDCRPFNTIMNGVVEKCDSGHIFLILSVLRYRLIIKMFKLLN